MKRITNTALTILKYTAAALVGWIVGSILL